jgi:tetraacyldisaccharide 4'-kinase
VKSLKEIVLSVMTGNPIGHGKALPVVLNALSKLYGCGVGLRSALYDRGMIRRKKLPCRVISIGNLSVGGTGKTPMTIYVARMLLDFGLKPVVISRGYKGTLGKKGGTVSDGWALTEEAGAAGDEALMMAGTLKGIPVLVGKNRFDAGLRAIKDFGADVIVLDDGFQHRQLHRDLDLVLIDDKTFLGNGHLIPRGILREPASGLGRSHACVLTRARALPTGHFEKLRHMFPEKEIFRAFHAPYIYGVFQGKKQAAEKRLVLENPEDFSFLNHSVAFVFSGIANNAEFREMVGGHVRLIAGYREYPDHHPYTRQNLAEIIRRAGECGADAVITTEKDFSRLGGQMQCPVDLVVIGVKICLGEDEARFCRFIRNRIQ